MNRSSIAGVVRAQAGKSYDYDLVIIGCGVGGHGAALHAVESVSKLFQHPVFDLELDQLVAPADQAKLEFQF